MARANTGLRTFVVAAALAIGACTGSTGTGSPSTVNAPSLAADSTAAPSPNPATAVPRPTPSIPADVESLEWAAILELPRVVGKFTIKPEDDPTYLNVYVNRLSVGRVFSRAYSDVELLGIGYLPTPEGLRQLAQRDIDQNRALHLADRPGGTFDPIGRRSSRSPTRMG